MKQALFYKNYIALLIELKLVRILQQILDLRSPKI